MKNILIIVFCTVFVCVRSECENSKCVDKTVKDILNEQSLVEDIDIKGEVPNFKQVKNIQDLNQILQSLTGWFEDKLNETNFIFKQVNNKTKIFVKTFDFKVDFESGKANIGLSLTGDHDKNTDNINNLNVNTDNLATTTVKSTIKENKITVNEPNINTLLDKRGGVEKNEIYQTIDFDTTYYDVNEDNSTDYPIIDYIEWYKDTNEEHVYTGTELPTTLADFIDSGNETDGLNTGDGSQSVGVCGESSCESFTKTVFPWVVAIFIKNDTENSQFNYVCDGALVSEKVILTDARCMLMAKETVQPENVLVFLGKGNLQSMASTEELHRVNDIKIHPNFTTSDKEPVNDLALIIMDEPATIGDTIQSACLHSGEDGALEEAATTAWGPNGHLLPIFFEKERSDICYDRSDDIFCATYGLKVALCPSYGGVYVAKRSSRWCLQGIFYGDPADRGLCFNRNVLYTSLNNYMEWIKETIEINK